MLVGSAVMVRVAGVPPLIPLAPFTFSQDAFERITKGEPVELLMVSCWLCTGPPTWAEKDKGFLSTATVCAFSAPAAHKIRIREKMIVGFFKRCLHCWAVRTGGDAFCLSGNARILPLCNAQKHFAAHMF